MNGTDITYRRAAALLVPVLLLLAFLAIAMVPAALAQSRQANAAIAQNNAALRTAQINLRYTRVPAPISGRIGLSCCRSAFFSRCFPISPSSIPPVTTSTS